MNSRLRKTLNHPLKPSSKEKIASPPNLESSLKALHQNLKNQKFQRTQIIQTQGRFSAHIPKVVKIDKTNILKVMSGTVKKETQAASEKNSLLDFLSRNGMQSFSKYITEQRGIDSIEKLMSLKQTQIQGLELPMGFKIKIRKQIQKSSIAYVPRAPPELPRVSEERERGPERTVEEIVCGRKAKTLANQVDGQDLTNLQQMFSQQIINYQSQPQGKENRELSTLEPQPDSDFTSPSFYCYHCLAKTQLNQVEFAQKLFCGEVCKLKYKFQAFCSVCLQQTHKMQLRFGRSGWVCQVHLRWEQQQQAQLQQSQMALRRQLQEIDL